MTAYYNENDSFAAAWLRELMKRNLIAPGEVDERDIRQVRADDLRGFTQCHFFAGIGVWSYALRQAGWPDDERVWTGSCPCQPFSVSGKRAGASDERHLWPIWFPLIRESRPKCVFGEQVASDDGLAWLDLVSADLEGQDYTLGAVDTPACGFGAPHRRQRLYWVADSNRTTRQQFTRSISGTEAPSSSERLTDGNLSERHRSRGATGSMADSSGRRCEQWDDESQRTVQLADKNGNLGDTASGRCGERGNASQPRNGGHDHSASIIDKLGDTGESGLEGFSGDGGNGNQPGRNAENSARSIAATGITNGFWRGAEWLWCRDQKYRPVEAGTFPLAHGVAKRVGKLRGFGNALVAPQAQAFIEAYRGIVACHERTGS